MSDATPTTVFSHRILLVEDDAGIASGVVRFLKRHGFEIELATDGLAGVRQFADFNPHLIILDLMLPELSGFQVLEAVRARSKVPVLVLTAHGELDARLKSFELGADDFLAKPFWLEELLARIKTRLQIRDEAPKRVIRWGQVVLDLDARTAAVGGAPAGLTPHEFDLLAYLVERPGRVVSRQQLSGVSNTPDDERDPRTVDSHIVRVRKKLGPDADAIATVRGVGYRYDPPASGAGSAA